MRRISASEARRDWAALLSQVEAGEAVTITRAGHPVARLVPVQPETSGEDPISALRSFRKDWGVRTMPVEEILKARDEGRP